MTDLPLSPLAPTSFPDLAPIAGIKLAVGASGMKYKGRDDLLLMMCPAGSTLAGVFTKSATAAAPVLWSKDVVSQKKGQAVIVNAGNANAFTGAAGMQAVNDYLSALATQLDIAKDEVLSASTGVIGEPLDATQITSCFTDLCAQLGSASWQQAANAIRTTDTFAKGATGQCQIAGTPIAISGIAKGSGMIAPDMATMLGFIATDAALDHDVLQACLTEAVKSSFNAITVDSDTSTSDMVLLAATGAAAHQDITSIADPALAEFRACLLAVMTDLAQQIVRDGEGASKFITIDVTGAVSAQSAAIIGKAIANSPLVKTAIAGEDANWGRIVMAVGKAGEPADRDRLSISIGGVEIAANGAVVAGYDEAPVAAHMQTSAIDIHVDLGLGEGTARIWSCDLTHGYISINADYRS